MFCERHIWASSPSICRRPFRSFALSFEEMLSNARDSKVSIFCVWNGQGLLFFFETSSGVAIGYQRIRESENQRNHGQRENGSVGAGCLRVGL